ncbi:MAG: hypothetical protein IT460_17305 [Planctomycetes bacterium]|nr:hypothetical protein [Planctomycetota bacterium]
MRATWAAAAVVVAVTGAAAVRADGVSAYYVPVGDEVSAVTAAVPSSVGLQAGELHAVVATADEPPTPRTTPPVTVQGERTVERVYSPAPEYPYGGGWSPTGLRQDTRLGPYGQPEWTTDRTWARVRSYVIAPGQIEFESWYRGRYKKHGEGNTHLFQEEVGIGLPHRFQFDVYLNFEDNPDRDLHFKETQVELRWALANWDCLFWNPTIYLEYKLHDDPEESDVLEAKLLFSDDIAPRWRGGVNLTYERELSGEEEEVLGFTAAVSYTVCDQLLSVGAEFQYERATVESARDDYEHTVYLGPSVSIRTSSTTHLDVAPLFGLTEESNHMQLFIVFGIEIGPGGGEAGWLNPIAARSN